MSVLAKARRQVRARIAIVIGERIVELADAGMPYARAVEQAMLDFVEGRLTR